MQEFLTNPNNIPLIYGFIGSIITYAPAYLLTKLDERDPENRRLHHWRNQITPPLFGLLGGILGFAYGYSKLLGG